MKSFFHRPRRGFLLLEMVLALTVFGIGATGFVVALHRMAATANLAQSELRITRLLDSALDEALSVPVLEEGENSVVIGDPGSEVEFETTIKLLDDLRNEEDQVLQEMYSIEVKAKWFENGAWRDRSVDTWRYGRMYQP
ncbi:MAG: type II secretion system protein [Gloeobacteraceae cyanobacterium ES-bin-144]|nr:type II secretion system protein [Verrucomicrobiales bacterium]